jgi:hypothetical protein
VTGRDAALWVITGLSAAAVAGTAAGLVMNRRERECGGDAVLALAAGLACFVWAAIGWAWYFSGGTVS